MVAVLVVVYVVVGVATGAVAWTAARQNGRRTGWSVLWGVWMGLWWPGTLGVYVVEQVGRRKHHAITWSAPGTTSPPGRAGRR